MKKIFCMLLVSAIAFSACKKDEKIEDIKIDYDREVLLFQMIKTSKLICQIANYPDVREEILSYASEKTGFEAQASFEDLLVEQTSMKHNQKIQGSFSHRLKELLENDESKKNSANGNNDSLDGEELLEFIVINNLMLYAPYYAENHTNSNKSITVSFDPLDDEAETTFGYRLNKEGIIEKIENIDDDYAQNNPVWIVIQDQSINNNDEEYLLGDVSIIKSSSSVTWPNCNGVGEKKMQLLMPQIRNEYRKDGGYGLRGDGFRIYNWDKFQYYFKPEFHD